MAGVLGRAAVASADQHAEALRAVPGEVGVMPRTDGGNGRARRYYPLDARRMAATCRKLARDLRAEHAAGWGVIHLSADHGGVEYLITRAEAADSLDEQADRWLREATSGEPNTVDRARIGM